MCVMIFIKVLNIIYITVSAFQRNDTREKIDLVFLRVFIPGIFKATRRFGTETHSNSTGNVYLDVHPDSIAQTAGLKFVHRVLHSTVDVRPVHRDLSVNPVGIHIHVHLDSTY